MGPDNLPVITDVRTAAKNLALAVLSVLAHARSPACVAILEAVTAALQELQETDPKTAGYFFDTEGHHGSHLLPWPGDGP